MAPWRVLALVAAVVACLQLSGQTAAGTPFQLGDANCDSAVNSYDAMLVLKDAAGLPASDLVCPENGDVDFHPGLSGQDALLILQYHAALLAALPPVALQDISTLGCPPREELSDGTLLANEVLSALSDDVLVDIHQRNLLAGEIDTALTTVGRQYLEVSGIHFRKHYAPGSIGLGADTQLMEVIRELVASGEARMDFVTGDPDFDLLNARLGLRGVYVFRATDSLYLCLADNVNVPAASDAYEALDGILYAHEDVAGGDGPTLAAIEKGGTWFVLFRQAGGDCPAGCTEQRFFYFSVLGSNVTPLDLPERGADTIYDALLHQMFPWR